MREIEPGKSALNAKVKYFVAAGERQDTMTGLG